MVYYLSLFIGNQKIITSVNYFIEFTYQMNSYSFCSMDNTGVVNKLNYVLEVVFFFPVMVVIYVIIM